MSPVGHDGKVWSKDSCSSNGEILSIQSTLLNLEWHQSGPSHLFMFSIFFKKYHSGCFACKVAWWALARGAAWSATLGLLQTAKSHRLSDGCLVLFLGLGISRQGPATSKCDATDATAYTVVN